MNPGLSIEETIINPSPQCYIPSFVEISPLVLEKKILKDFTIYGRGGHLGHLTINILITFHFLVHKSLHAKFELNELVVSEKSKF